MRTVRKISTTLILLVGILYTFQSCQKEAIIIENETPKSVIIDNIKINVNPKKAVDLVVCPLDADETKIYINLLDIAKLTSEYAKTDAQFIKTIINEAKKNSNNELTYKELFKKISVSKDYKLHNLIDRVNNSDFTHYSTNPDSKNPNEDYEAGIYIPNIDIADFSKEPLICPGFEIDTDTPGMEEYDDYIMAYYYGENDVPIELLLDENTAKSITNPIVIVVNSEIENFQMNLTNNVSANPTPSFDLTFKLINFTINHRYERGTYSEFIIVGKQLTQDFNGGYYWESVFRYWLGDFQTETFVYSVHRNSIGQLIDLSRNTAKANYITDINQKFIFWNTFEKDWYASEKSLGEFSRNDINGSFKGRRVFTNEWYSYDPSEVNNNPLNIVAINLGNANSQITYTNPKGLLSFGKR